MRFMMLMLPGNYESSPSDPTGMAEHMIEMGRYNDAMRAAGILVDANGLTAPSLGARVRFPSRRPTIVDGPFAEAKEVVGGYWLIDVASRQEAIDWAARCPATENETIEVRQVQNAGDFPAEVKAALGRLAGRTPGAALRPS